MNAKFQVGDLVIAKLRGHPSWPAIISRIEDKGKSHVYNVVFFGSKDQGMCRGSELSSYTEHKNKLFNNKKTNENLKLAISEVEEELKKRNKTKPLKKLLNSSTNNSKENSTTLVSTPHSEQRTQDETKKDIGVNTPVDLDLNFQLQAVTDRCISLEKSLLEEKSHLEEKYINGPTVENTCDLPSTVTTDFHKQILIQELKNAKSEILNLNSVIVCLQNDNKLLQDKIEEINNKAHRCMRCFPLLKDSGSNNNPWIKSKDVKNFPKTKQEKPVNFESNNSFTLLSTDSFSENPTNSSQTLHCSKNKPIENTRSKNTRYRSKSKVPSANSTKNDLLILADSHGKNLSHMVQERSSVNTFSCVRSGAKFSGVVQDLSTLSKNLTKEGHILIIAGTNNMESMGSTRFLREVQELLGKLIDANLILATLPMRHDQPKLDLKISQINKEIEVMAAKSNCLLLPLHLLPRHLYTNHGQHLNKRGKARVAEMIVQIISKDRLSKKTQLNSDSSYMPLLSSGSGITVVEADIRHVFEQFKGDPSVAMAHTISSDFQDQKHMSAGVAVAFREKFGRPKLSDLVFTSLACQKFQEGPTIYSLITKSRYFGKPSKSDYNGAFDQLKQDFKSKGLSTLICSPMGCCRDLIEPQHFVHKIIDFHRETGAHVKIVSSDQGQSRGLWKGLSHEEFVETLKRLINSATTPTTTPVREHLTGVNTSTPCPERPSAISPSRDESSSRDHSVMCGDQSQSSVIECVSAVEGCSVYDSVCQPSNVSKSLFLNKSTLSI